MQRIVHDFTHEKLQQRNWVHNTCPRTELSRDMTCSTGFSVWLFCRSSMSTARMYMAFSLRNGASTAFKQCATPLEAFLMSQTTQRLSSWLKTRCQALCFTYRTDMYFQHIEYYGLLAAVRLCQFCWFVVLKCIIGYCTQHFSAIFASHILSKQDVCHSIRALELTVDHHFAFRQPNVIIWNETSLVLYCMITNLQFDNHRVCQHHKIAQPQSRS